MFPLNNYDHIFLDFDGLLVNTEYLHYLAYTQMCKNHGKELSWSFSAYCDIAHVSSEKIRNRVYADFPDLYKEFPDWSTLYAEKKTAYEQMLQEKQVELMPGVELFLKAVDKMGIPCSVVTNSFRKQIDTICEHIPALATIAHWVTREDYQGVKPDPAPYLTAKSRYTRPTERIVGFEDTVRGWQSLQGAGIEGVVISNCLSTQFRQYLEERKVPIFSSFIELLSK